MALSLNPGSRGLLMDPFNGAADIEAKLIRVLHNYAFVEDPSRLIRAARFAARFHWPLEERTQARFESAKENNYIEYITDRAIGHEIEQLAYEDDPLHIVRVLEKEELLKVLNPHWTTAKVDTAGLGQLMKTRQQMNELGYTPDPSPAVLYFLTARLGDKDIADMRKLIPRKDLVEAWKDLEDNAKDLAKRLTGKGSGDAVADLEAALGSAAGDDPVPGSDGEAAGGGAEDQELLHQVAAGAAEDSVARDDGAAHHAADAGISEDRARCIHAAAGRQAAFADGDSEIPEAAGAASAAASTSAATQAGTSSESGCRRGSTCRGWYSDRRQEKGKGIGSSTRPLHQRLRRKPIVPRPRSHPKVEKQRAEEDRKPQESPPRRLRARPRNQKGRRSARLRFVWAAS